MERTYWHKQRADQPLFPDLLWSRPENRAAAGKLLIAGGNQYGFAAPAEAYTAAMAAGIGTARVLLPQAIKKATGGMLPDLEYAASGPSGSFAQAGLGEFLEQASWADGLLLAGDFGHNSETAILIEKLLLKYSGQITITQDAADYCLALSSTVLNRDDTLLVISTAQLQKLAAAAHFSSVFTLGMDLLHLVDNLHQFTTMYPAKIILKHNDQLIVAVNGEVSTTKLGQDLPIWRVKTASSAGVWWLQNLSLPFEALTTSIFTVVEHARK